MTLWRRARTEVAGSRGDRPVSRPGRLAVASAVGVLAVVGTAGSYFAVVHGFGALAGDRPEGVEPYPLTAEAPPGSGGERAHSGLGGGTAEPVDRTPAAATTIDGPAPGVNRVLPAQAPAAPSAPRVMPSVVVPGVVVPSVVVPPRPPQITVGGQPQSPPIDCCPAPPVPTPTVPAPTSHSPTVTPSPTESWPDESAPAAPSPSPSSAVPASPDDIPGTDEDEDASRHAGHTDPICHDTTRAAPVERAVFSCLPWSEPRAVPVRSQL